MRVSSRILCRPSIADWADVAHVSQTISWGGPGGGVCEMPDQTHTLKQHAEVCANYDAFSQSVLGLFCCVCRLARVSVVRLFLSLYMFISMLICTLMCMRLCVCMYVCMYFCMYVFLYVCMYVCMYVCAYAYVCIFVCMYIRM